MRELTWKEFLGYKDTNDVAKEMGVSVTKAREFINENMPNCKTESGLIRLNSDEWEQFKSLIK